MEKNMASLIQPTDAIYIWAVVIGILLIACYLDQQYKWANKLSVAVMCTLSGAFMGNLHILPFSSPVYNGISKTLLYVAIPMLLFKSDIRRLIRNGGRVFIAFHISAGASALAALIYGPIIKHFGMPNVAGITAMKTGGSIGGAVNSAAMAKAFDINDTLMSASTLTGNFCLGLLLILLGIICSSKWVRKHMVHPYINAREAEIKMDPSAKDRPVSAAFWKSHDLSLLEFLKSLATAFIIVALSKFISTFVKSLNPPFIIQQLCGSIYLVITTLTVIGATFLPKWFSNLKFGNEMGSMILNLWLMTLGLTADIKLAFAYGVVFILIFIVIVLCHLLVAFPIAKISKLSLEEICCATIASIGGPSTATALTISQGWRDLIAPSIVSALWGYVIGNYIGVFIGNIFL